MSIFSSYKKIFLLGFIIVILIAIPVSVYLAQQRQQTTSQAAKSTILSLDPVSATTKVGEILTFGVVLNPDAGTATPPTPNQVSFVKLFIKFDPEKFTTITKTDTEESLAPNPISANTLTFVLEDAVYNNTLGTASISLSIGADPTRVVTTKTKIAILKLKALSTTSIPSKIEFITTDAQTQVLSIASSDQTSENVLSSAEFATATITSSASSTGTTPTPTPPPGSTPTPTPASGFGTISNGLVPVCSSLNVDRITTGTAPYSLTFTAVGNDPDSTVSKVSFNFGDGPVQDATSGGGIGTNSVNVQISHTYNNSGSYTAYAILTDNKGNLSAQQESCTKTITINSATALEDSTLQTIDVIPTQPVQPIQEPLPPTGPGENILGIGVIGAIFTIIGGALFILL